MVTLAKVLKTPLNRLVNEAVQTYVVQRSREVVSSMEETIKLLRQIRSEDPQFERAIAVFVDSEASHAGHDPAQGEIEPPRATVESRVRQLLDG